MESQNSTLKIINFKPFRYNTANLYKTYKIVPFEDSIKVTNIMFVFDFFQNNLPRSFHSFFTPTNLRHEHNTRNNNIKLLLPPFTTKKYGKKSIKHQCVSDWNSHLNLFIQTFNRMYGINNRYRYFLNLNKKQFYNLIISTF